MTTQQLHPSAAQIRREARRQQLQLIARVVLIFAAWCVVVLVLAWLLGA
jgi:hypothetical protein